MNSALMFSKASDLWTTPRELFDGLLNEFDMLVDVAATRENRMCVMYVGPGHSWGANWDNYLTFDLHALMEHTTAAAWMNPPYSQCAEFIAKAAQDAKKGCTVVALIPSRTDTRYWHAHIWDREKHQPRPGVEVRFIKGRLKFGGQKNGAPFPSCIVVFRPVTTIG